AHSQNRGAVAAGFDAISLKRKETSFYRIARFRHLPGRIHHPKRAARLGTPVRSSVPRLIGISRPAQTAHYQNDRHLDARLRIPYTAKAFPLGRRS
ncbi:MAG TPA: hypothetical protein VFP47_09955, partial [Pyrinomonadaceae bacterium]|nr:hypothetical protein [Pyrinomonadaceae bacterium]